MPGQLIGRTDLKGEKMKDVRKLRELERAFLHVSQQQAGAPAA